MKHLKKFESFGSTVNESILGTVLGATSILAVSNFLGHFLGHYVLGGELKNSIEKIKDRWRYSKLETQSEKWVKENLVDDEKFLEDYVSLQQQLKDARSAGKSLEERRELEGKILNSFKQKLEKLKEENPELHGIILNSLIEGKYSEFPQ